DENFTAYFGSRLREPLGIDILLAVGALLIVAAPNDDDIAVVERREGGALLKIVGRRVRHDIPRYPRIAAGQESRINMLKACSAALPNKGRSAVLQQTNLRLFLIARPALVHSKARQVAGQAAVQSPGADACSVPI